MSRDPTQVIGLSEEEATELMWLRNDYQARIGYRISEPAIWFGNHLSNYLSALCLDAAIENYRLKTRRSTSLRKDALRVFESYLGRRPTAEDLLKELVRFVTVPESVANAIRMDVDRLLA